MARIRVISYQFQIRLIGTSWWKESKSPETILSSQQSKRGWIAFCFKLNCFSTVVLKASKSDSSFFSVSKCNCQRVWCALWRRTCSELWGNFQTSFILHSSWIKQAFRAISQLTPRSIKVQQPCWLILEEELIIPTWMFPLANANI